MKKHRFSAVVLSLAILPICAFAEDVEEPKPGKNQHIVVFQPGTPAQGRAEAVGRHGQVKKHLEGISATVGVFPPGREADVRNEAGVVRVEPDVIVEALGRPDGDDLGKGQGKPGGGAAEQPPQSTPWGIARVKAPEANAVSQGAGVNVCVIDTGIDLTHPDLQANIKGGYNAISPSKSANDDNGHGTHVAGTIAALHNAIGVVGVGPKTNLLAVKVLGRSGSGWTSDIIEGILWCKDNGGKVANLSLGSLSDVQALHDAVIQAYNAGVTVVAAAGNGGPCANCVSYPARYPEAIAVTASDSGDQFAGFSSQGPEVDLIAPGKGILSATKGGAYATYSGTSMAAPHVSGCAGLKLAQNAALQPAEVLAALKASAASLAGLNAEQQGAGIPDCQKLVSAP